MEQLQLILPDMSMELAARGYKLEHAACGERALQGSSFFDEFDDYKKWLARVNANANPATITPDWVLTSVFFAVKRSDGRLVGMTDIRHELNRCLTEFSGHIGYGIRPTERGRGYGRQLLRLALDKCGEFGMKYVLLGCYKQNIPSSRTIISCGGELIEELRDGKKRVIQRYIIEL